MKFFLTLLSTLFIYTIVSGQTAPSWTEFVDNKAEGKSATLPDYSYAGYHFSEKEIPDISLWSQFDVTDYGAIADDELYDDDAIQATIDAAEASDGPAVVFFPAGKFIVSEDNSVANWIQVSRDSIVIKGSGSGDGGTEIFMDQMRVQNGHWQFTFQPPSTSILTISILTEPVSRGDYQVFVDNTESLEVGQTIHIYHKSEEFARSHFGDLELSDTWTRLFGSGGGMTVYEPHIITEISGSRVTFKNPIQADLPDLSGIFVLREHTTIQEVGVEDILFTSNWENYGETFVHHKDDIHDYGWNALRFENVKNSWIQNCEFRSWSQAIDITQSIGVTIQNIVISGEKGHASINTRRGYGLLVKDSEDLTGQHHGPNTGYQGVNTVYLRYTMQKDQSVDCHSGQPYATLIDDVEGGDFDQNGGPIESYPHHGQHLTFWNFRHSTSSDKTYNFWPTDRNGFTYALPLFVGFQPDTDVIFLNEGLNEMEGQMVEPRSLFDAQLALRISSLSQNPTVSFSEPGNDDEFEIGSDLRVEVVAQDPDGSIVGVKLYFNDQLIREDTEAPYVWGEEVAVDPDLFEMSAGVYQLKAEVTDDDGNTALDSIDIVVGSIPVVSFNSPSMGEIVEAGEAVEVAAEVSDSDGTISTVSLYFDDDLVRTLTEEPFTWGADMSLDPLLFDLVSGEHTLKLEVVDNDGLQSVALQTIIANAFPTIAFTTPTDNQVFEFGSNIPLNVSAEDVDGSIVKVDMFINGTFHREELGAPYDWGLRSDADPILFDLVDGDYVFEAVAYDDLGSSSSISIETKVNPEIVPLSTATSSEKIKVYPNPFKEEFVIYSASTSLSDIQFYTIDGRDLSPLITIEPNGDQVIVSAKLLDKGVYFFHYVLNGESNTMRLIKE